MSVSCQQATRPLVRFVRQSQLVALRSSRSFTSTSSTNEEAQLQKVSHKTQTVFHRTYNPATTTSRKGEEALLRRGIKPIGSRRRRAALQHSANIPFEQLPYQCFQEARKILQADREEKLQEIARERAKIARLTEQDASTIKGGELQKQRRLDSLQRYLEELKILADINDPLIKKRFEDGLGDMNKPIYRHLADKKWRSYERNIIVQRIQQLALVPDLLPHFEPTADVSIAFRRRNVHPGEFVDSRVSEVPARLQVQVFDKGERLVSVVVIDSDVPDLESDNFTFRCHYLAANIPISPTNTSLPLHPVFRGSQIVLPWLPPHAQKGSPAHRLSIFVLQHGRDQTLDIEDVKKRFNREGFSLNRFKDTYKLMPIGASVFRSQWDEGTAGVMERAGLKGADIEFKRKRIPALKPKEKKRGWEARHSGPKYNWLHKPWLTRKD